MTRPARSASAPLSSMILPLAWGIALATALAAASAIGLALALDGAHAAAAVHVPAHEHAHHHAHDNPQQPGSESGSQPAVWDQPATTQALRTGMTRLRQTLQGQSAQALDTPAALDLQRNIEADIAALIAACDLPAEADAVLHGVLAELTQGAAALNDSTTRDAGLQQLNDGLHAYSELFAGPHWSQAPAAMD